MQDLQYDKMFINVRNLYYTDKKRKHRITSYLAHPNLLILVDEFFKNKNAQLKSIIGTTRILAVLTSTDLMIDKTFKTYVISQKYVKSIAKSLGVKEKAFRYAMEFINQYKFEKHNRIAKKAATYKIPRFEPKFGSQKKFIFHLTNYFKGNDTYTGFYNSQNSKLKNKKIDLETSKSKQKSSKQNEKTSITKHYKFYFEKENVSDLKYKYNQYKNLPESFITRKNRQAINSFINYVENILLKNNPNFFENCYINVTEKVSNSNGRVFSILTNMPKKIREILFSNWTSIDINNAAPNLIINLALKVDKNIKENASDFYQYAKDRKKYLKDLYKFPFDRMMSFELFERYMKQILLPLIFGANLHYDKYLIEKNKEGSSLKNVFNEMKLFLGKDKLKIFQKVLFSKYMIYIERLEKDLNYICNILNTNRKGLSNLFMKEETKIMNYIFSNILREIPDKNKIRIHDEVMIKEFDLQLLFEIENFLKENNLKCKIQKNGKRINLNKILIELENEILENLEIISSELIDNNIDIEKVQNFYEKIYNFINDNKNYSSLIKVKSILEDFSLNLNDKDLDLILESIDKNFDSKVEEKINFKMKISKMDILDPTELEIQEIIQYNTLLFSFEINQITFLPSTIPKLRIYKLMKKLE